MTDMNKPIQNFKQMLQEAAVCLHGRNLNEASALAQEVIRLSKASGDYETYTRALNTLGVIQQLSATREKPWTAILLV